MMKIFYLNGDKAGESQELRPPGVAIGRETDNDIQLLVGGVSRYHAKIDYQDGTWIIRDLGSTNGTKINGLRIDGPRPLLPGDVVAIGDQTFRFGDISTIQTSASVSFTGEDAKVKFKPQSSPGATPVSPSPQPAVIFRAPTSSPGAIDPGAEKASQAKVFSESFRTSSAVSLPSPAAPQNADVNHMTGDIFGRASTDAPTGKKGIFVGKKRISNVTFYIFVISVAVICISLFISLQKEADKKAGASFGAEEKKRSNFLLVYEKQTVTPDNVFRFTLNIENGAALIVLDDLKYSRHFRKSLGSMEMDVLKNFEDTVKDTDFMKLDPEPAAPAAGENDNYRSITLGYDNELNRIAVRNTYAKSSFEAVERAIEDFVENYGLRTISLDINEMRNEAEKAFSTAETLFASRDARPENLREAIVRYELVITLLDQFEPKPKEWDIARTRLAEAQTISEQRIKDAAFQVDLLRRKKQYVEAIKTCDDIMRMVDPESESHAKIKKVKLQLEKIVMGNKR